jgi:tellurite resistance-related uncharacterized protein
MIPADFQVRRSTRFFTPATVPPALLERHNTAEGVYGQVCVIEGWVRFHGFASAGLPDQTRLINAGEFAVAPPQYWHRVELSDDARFNIHFWADPKDQAPSKLWGKATSEG